jgi:TPR repeat protein
MTRMARMKRDREWNLYEAIFSRGCGWKLFSIRVIREIRGFIFGNRVKLFVAFRAMALRSFYNASVRGAALAMLLVATSATGQTNAVAVLELEGLKAKAVKGNAKLQFELAEMYFHGNGVTQSMAEATLWYRRAAEKDYAPAQLGLGHIYNSGPMELRDQAEAVHWYRKAADHGLAPAQFALGFAYETGHGVKADLAEASAWYRFAAVRGLAQAQFRLGTLYYDGRGVEQNFVEGIKWWRKAAEQGMSEALFNLGLSSMNGRGLLQDPVEAYKWFILAAHQGSKMAEANRDALEKALRPEQAAEGRQRAEAFVAKMSMPARTK